MRTLLSIESPVKDQDDIDQIRLALSNYNTQETDWASDEFWSLIDLYTSPVLADYMQRRLLYLQQKLADDAPAIADMLKFEERTENADWEHGFYTHDLAQAFRGILAQCGVELASGPEANNVVE
jgi:hypothetical protein